MASGRNDRLASDTILSLAIQQLKTLTQNPPEEIPYTTSMSDFAKTVSVFISEIGMPFIGGFYGAYIFFSSCSSGYVDVTTLQLPLYILAALLDGIDSFVHYMLMFESYKEAVGVTAREETKVNTPALILPEYLQNLIAASSLGVFMLLRVANGSMVLKKFFISLLGASFKFAFFPRVSVLLQLLVLLV